MLFHRHLSNVFHLIIHCVSVGIYYRPLQLTASALMDGMYRFFCRFCRYKNNGSTE
ncbi:hypothetical protein L208DRAFT_1395289 [Tricholoma matsutake]|nr:hypothetical protein L208DRAFT_1395289 [Tricholoma matsutake 945]